MEELITKREAVDIVRFECGEWVGLAKTIENKINAHPPTPPQRTGHWIPMTYRYVPSEKPPDTVIKWMEATEPDDIEGLKCSECGEIVDSRMINKYPYCHCGAEMSGGSEDETDS